LSLAAAILVLAVAVVVVAAALQIFRGYFLGTCLCLIFEEKKLQSFRTIFNLE
jgi:hypothetical protein